MYTLGVDVGGTFVDLAVVEGDGKVRIEKVSTSDSEGIFDCVLQGLTRMGITPQAVGRVAFGTTIATNAVLERRGARVGLLCTQGFKDILEHQRWHRRHQYDLHEVRPDPLVPRWLRAEVSERVAADGSIVREVGEEDVEQALEIFKKERVEAIAVCFVNAYANGANERAALDVIRRRGGWSHVSVSSAIAPLIREWERTSTTVINAYTQPVTASYLGTFERKLEEFAPNSLLTVMQSNGGVTSVEEAIQKPVRTMLSGPAGGVIGGAALAAQAGLKDIITIDMGGTSCDVAVLKDATPELTKESQIEYNMPVMVPMIRIHTIGAGGGSIAWVDRGGVMKVGPQSAGANPGPVCYGREGVEPTVTDAQFILGRLSPGGLLGGRMSLLRDAAEEAFLGRVCKPLGLTLEDAVVGVIKIANVKMAEAIRLLTTNRGMDPRDFTLVAFGGAGPMHACELAEMLGMHRVVIPPCPGVMSALGLATASRKTDAIVSVNRSLDTISADELNSIFEALEEKCRCVLSDQGVECENQVLMRAGDFRYEGQSFEVSIPLDSGNYTPASIADIARRFHERHFDLYRYSRKSEIPFVVSLEVVGAERLAGRSACGDGGVVAKKAAEPLAMREVYLLDRERFRRVPIYARERLDAGSIVEGPAVVEQFDSTILITESFRAEVDGAGNLVAERRQ